MIFCLKYYKREGTLLKKIRSLFYQLTGIDQYDTDMSSLSNIKQITNSEKKAAQILKQYPHLKESEVIQDTEQGWIRVVR
jgi:hypothetical protein